MAVQDDAISALRTIVFEYNGREGNRYGKEAVIEAIDALASYNNRDEAVSALRHIIYSPRTYDEELIGQK
jgi:hypothetical protein